MSSSARRKRWTEPRNAPCRRVHGGMAFWHEEDAIHQTAMALPYGHPVPAYLLAAIPGHQADDHRAYDRHQDGPER